MPITVRHAMSHPAIMISSHDTHAQFRADLDQGAHMYQDNRPLETLAAFALSFAAGMLATAALSVYTEWVRRKTHQTACNSQA